MNRTGKAMPVIRIILTGIFFIMVSFTADLNVYAGCRDNDCGCGGTWKSSWKGNAYESCTGTDCWYDPDTGEGCAGHVWYYYKTTKERTCTESGTKVYLCSNCSAVWIKTIEASGHKYGTWESSDETLHQRTCSACGDIRQEAHVFSDWTVISQKEKKRVCSVCGYTEDWKDDDPPEVSDFTVSPEDWTDNIGTVSFTVRDEKSGTGRIELKRKSISTGKETTVLSVSGSGSTEYISKSYTEVSEGTYSFSVYVTDTAGNETVMYGGILKIDRSDPSLQVNAGSDEWTNTAPVISASSEDYLTGTNIMGSGIKETAITGNGKRTAGINEAVLVLDDAYEGSFTWTVTAEDQVGHITKRTVQTLYDCTKPVIIGAVTEIVETEEGEAVYCSDNMIDQIVSDAVCSNGRSGSGLKSVLMYRVKNGVKHAVYSDTTRAVFTVQNPGNSFEVIYDASADDADYYIIAAQDFAGNTVTQKLVSQKALLKSFHTSIERSSYK